MQRLGFQTHQASRYLVFDGEDQVDVELVTHTIQSRHFGICSRDSKAAQLFLEWNLGRTA
jgi:hypothetical protein